LPSHRLLLGIVALSWSVFWLNRHSSTGGLNLMGGAVLATLLAVAGVCVEVGVRAADRWIPEVEAEPAPVRRRPW
jgi:hypothetical protein